jgi:hypothetical protein
LLDHVRRALAGDALERSNSRCDVAVSGKHDGIARSSSTVKTVCCVRGDVMTL